MADIAFYAPIKPPDHPIASGDRLIARNLIAALEQAGHGVTLASRFIAYSKRPNAEILAARKQAALAEADAIIQRLRPDPPALWLTYHPYCKAPDWIGPAVSRALHIPYVTVEAARTGQGFENGQDLWRDWRQEAQRGMKQADLHLAFKPQDAAMLRDVIGPTTPVEMLKPFIAPLPDPSTEQTLETTMPMLLAVGMMRPGKKEQNFRLLLEALRPLTDQEWHLVLVGDGPVRPTLEEDFKTLGPDRVTFTGAVDHTAVLALMKQAALFCWPGWKEPIGMVYLEAQTMGLPVIAMKSMGVPLTVLDGETGLLSAEGDTAALGANIAKALNDHALRDALAAHGPRHIAANHSLSAAAVRLEKTLSPLLER